MYARSRMRVGFSALVSFSACTGKIDGYTPGDSVYTSPSQPGESDASAGDAGGDSVWEPSESEGETPSGVQGGATDAGGTTLRDGGQDAGSDAGRDAAVARDAATPKDAASPLADAAQDAEAPGDGSCPGIFCEDFEKGSLDPSVWTRITTDNNANTVGVQSDVVAHGRHAARFHATGGSNRALMFNERLPAALGTHYFGRAYLRIKGFPFENGGHTAYIWAAASADGFPYADHHLEIGHYFQNNAPIWQLTYWTGDGPEYIHAGGHIPQDAWFCVEWEFNDRPDQIAVWVDGSLDPNGSEFRSINNGESGLLGSLGVLGIGFRTFHESGAPDSDVYLDDLVLDTKRIPCLTP
ncbi:MAG: hypothetical protein RL385_738 [Pseudomonadota bacterium]